MRASGKKTFVATNSGYSYTRVGCVLIVSVSMLRWFRPWCHEVYEVVNMYVSERITKPRSNYFSSSSDDWRLIDMLINLLSPPGQSHGTKIN